MKEKDTKMKITEHKLRNIIRSVIKEAVEGKSGGIEIACRYGTISGSIPRFLLIRTDNSSYESKDDDKNVSSAEELASEVGVHQKTAKMIFDKLSSVPKDVYVDLQFESMNKKVCHVMLKGRPTLGDGKNDLGRFMVSTGEAPTKKDQYSIH
jgi:hypothetical protein